MSSYHTNALEGADIFTVMGSVYAEVARYDTAISLKQPEMANQAIARAEEIINYTQSLARLNGAQKKEVKQFGILLSKIANKGQKSNLDSYLMPFAVAQRMRQSR